MERRGTNRWAPISFPLEISFPYVKPLMKSLQPIYGRYLSTRHQTRRGDDRRRTPFLDRNYGVGSREVIARIKVTSIVGTIGIILSSFAAVRSSARFLYQRQGELPPARPRFPSDLFSCDFLSQCQGDSANRSMV